MLGSLGDSRAVLYRSEIGPVATNIVHRPSKPSELKRIVAEGGQVCSIQGIDRVIKKTKNATIGLSVSRAMGNYLLKDPKPIISSIPEFTETVVDLDLDQFLVLGTDGVFDYVSDTEIGDLVSSTNNSRSALQKTAEKIVQLAKSRGSIDDRTIVIAKFAWNNPIIDDSPNEDDNIQQTQALNDDDDDDIFKI